MRTTEVKRLIAEAVAAQRNVPPIEKGCLMASRVKHMAPRGPSGNGRVWNAPMVNHAPAGYGAGFQVWQARDALIIAIKQQIFGVVTMDAVYQAADTYIAAIKAHGKATGRRLPVPNRAGIIRLLT